MLKRYSHSALRTYRECPRQFKFRYIERVSVPRRLSADTHLGNIVHRVLRQLYRLGADGIVMPKADALAAFDEAWSATDLGAITVPADYYALDDYQRIGREILSAHYDVYQPFKIGKLLGTELRCAFTLPGTDIKLTAIIDRLMKRDDGTVEICDYKTGQRVPQPRDADYFYQMGIYTLAVRESYPVATSIEVTQHMLRSDEKVTYRFSDEELDQLTDEIRSVVLETVRAQRDDDFPATEGTQCRYCDYYELCPAKRHKLMLEAEERADDASDGRPMKEIARELATRYLAVYEEEKRAGNEREALKADLVRLAREYDMTVFDGDGGQVKIKLGSTEKFISKTKDAEAFARLNVLVRDFKLDDYLVVDSSALMKEIFRKQRLPEDALAKLSEFVVKEEETRVTVRWNKEEGGEDDLAEN